MPNYPLDRQITTWNAKLPPGTLHYPWNAKSPPGTPNYPAEHRIILSSFDNQSLSCAFRERYLLKCMRVLTLGKKSYFSAAFNLRHVDTVIIFACRAGIGTLRMHDQTQTETLWGQLGILNVWDAAWDGAGSSRSKRPLALTLSKSFYVRRCLWR